MKKRYLFLIPAFVILLLIAFNVFAYDGYERTPAGENILNPVTFKIKDVASFWGCEGYLSWEFVVRDYPLTDYIFSSCQNEMDIEVIFAETLPVTSYRGTQFWCYNELGCAPESLGEVSWFEEGEPAFSILAPPVTPFVETGTGFVESSLAYVGQAISGLGPLLYFIIGAPISFWALKKVIGLIPKK
jgi:hypothetical protein